MLVMLWVIITSYSQMLDVSWFIRSQNGCLTGGYGVYKDGEMGEATNW